MSAGSQQGGSFLYVKNWRELQHYSKRNPPWIKLYRRLLHENDFLRLSEFEQWQLVRLWLMSAEEHPGGWLENDESMLRRGIGSMKPVPVGKLIAQGWLEVRTAAEFASAVASPDASAGASTDARNDPPMLPPREAEVSEKTETTSTNGFFGDIGWNDNQRTEALRDEPRARAWVKHARSDAKVLNAAAFAWAGFKEGGWPPKTVPNSRTPQEPPTCEECGNLVRDGHTASCGVGLETERALAVLAKGA